MTSWQSCKKMLLTKSDETHFIGLGHVLFFFLDLFASGAAGFQSTDHTRIWSKSSSIRFTIGACQYHPSLFFSRGRVCVCVCLCLLCANKKKGCSRRWM